MPRNKHLLCVRQMKSLQFNILLQIKCLRTMSLFVLGHTGKMYEANEYNVHK